MTRINLLPWREIERAERLRQFLIALGVSAAIAAVLLLPIYLFVEHLVSNQQSRNSYIDSEISKLNDQIAEIKELKSKKAQLLNRMNVIQQLQADRNMIVHIFDELVQVIPGGIHITDIQKIGPKFVLNGISDSNQGISKMMRSISDSKWLTHPILMQINTTTKDGVRTSNFKLEMFQKVVSTVAKEEEEF